MNNQQAPKFWVYAKRKHSTDPIASLYVKIVFEEDAHEKSMGIKCPYECHTSNKNGQNLRLLI